jgi:hypothetical protein
MVNLFVSIMPLGFVFTWVYVKNGRSIFACMIFHFFVNLLQEEVAMTQVTKCVETAVLFAAAALIVAANRDMFFETRHVGRICEGHQEPLPQPASPFQQAIQTVTGAAGREDRRVPPGHHQMGDGRRDAGHREPHGHRRTLPCDH